MKRKLGKERWREKGNGLLLTVKKKCLDHLSSKVFKVLCAVSEVERVGNSLCFSWFFFVSACLASCCACGDCSFLGCGCGL